MKARVAFGVPDQQSLAPPETALERRYALRSVKQRLHQASFREAVITAYKGRCALSGLPEPLLLDAAHIVADKDEQLGQPVVPNGIPLSKIHHAAFDAHLIGIDPDHRLHVADRLLRRNDGAILEALKRLNGQEIYLPTRAKDWPDRDALQPASSGLRRLRKDVRLRAINGIDYSGAEMPTASLKGLRIYMANRASLLDGSLSGFLSPALPPAERTVARIEG